MATIDPAALKGFLDEQDEGDDSTGGGVAGTLSGIIIRAAGVDEEDLAPEASLAGLGIDSIARVEIAIRIEDELDVRITDSDITPDTTLGELETLVESRRAQG